MRQNTDLLVVETNLGTRLVTGYASVKIISRTNRGDSNMATCFGAVRPLGQLRVFNIIVCNVRKQQVCNRNYTKRARKKKRTIQEEGKLDIGGILSGSGASWSASSGNKLVPGNDTTTNKSLQDTAVKGWQSSKERTSLLRKGEKRWAQNFKFL